MYRSVAGGNNWRGSQGEPTEARYVPPACAAHANWVLLLGFTVMKPPLSYQAEKSSLFMAARREAQLDNDALWEVSE